MEPQKRDYKPFVDVDRYLFVDDRGSVYCALDKMNTYSMTDDFAPNMNLPGPIKRTYVVHNWGSGRIRAWHGHRNGWTGIHVISGAAKVVAVPIGEDDKLTYIERMTKSAVLSDKNPGIFWVPPGWFNGHMSLKDDTKMLIYSTHTFEEVKDDDVRCCLSNMDVKRYFEVENR